MSSARRSMKAATPPQAPYWSRALRALRESGGVTRETWSALLGYGRTTVQRWETGETAPDAAAEAAIVALCHQRALFRRYDAGPLAGVTATPVWLAGLLAGARLGSAGRAADAEDVAPAGTRVVGGSSAARSNLPAALTSFIGREQERAEVARLLTETRLLTLAGAGGCGKTRLAVETARGLLAADEETNHPYADGVWLVELAAIADPGLALPAVAATLGVREEAGRRLEDSLLAFLSPRRLLLLLDNCEHLVAACARLADTLLRTCPHLTILTTSREPLQIAGETVYRVPSMALPAGEWRVGSGESGRPNPPAPFPTREGGALISAALPDQGTPLPHSGGGAGGGGHATRHTPHPTPLPDAVRLFAERARAVRPDFAVTDANAEVVARICRRLDGIPLAIELAAARLNALSVEGVAGRLDDRFRLLTMGSRVALPRHQTLRALVDWSYDLLDEAERRLFARLSVFAGSFSLEAAAAVAGMTDVGAHGRAPLLDLLAQLVDKSLVVAEVKGGEARYRLLETLRRYAHERLDASGETAAIADRHRDYYLALAEQAEQELRGSAQTRWLDLLTDEHDNLRAALQWCEQDPAGVEPGLRLARALWRFWEVRGHLSEGRGWLERSLARAGDAAPNLRAKALNTAGTLATNQGDYREAVRLYEQSLVLGRAAGDRATVAVTLTNLGSAHTNLGNDEAARLHHEEGLAIRQELDDQWGIAFALHNLAYLAHRQGDFARAQTLYEQSLAIKRAFGDTAGIAGNLNNQGDLAQRRGEYARARALFEESLALRRQVGDERGAALTLHGLGEVAYRQGEYAEAASLYAESLRIASGLGAKRYIVECLEGLAAVAAALGRPHESIVLFSAGDAQRRAINAPLPVAERASHDQIVAAARSATGEAAFPAAWAEGAAMAHDQVIALALQVAVPDQPRPMSS